jgi:cytochrome b involved in lipid metabolism
MDYNNNNIDYNNDLYYECIAQKTGSGVQIIPSPAPTPTPAPINPTPADPAPVPTTLTYTLADVSTHNTRNSCWMVVQGKVYDATSYINNHPGGSAILQGCGTDATSMFASIHSPNAYNILDGYFIGNLG